MRLARTAIHGLEQNRNYIVDPGQGLRLEWVEPAEMTSHPGMPVLPSVSRGHLHAFREPS